jgi:hypothetical protein
MKLNRLQSMVPPEFIEKRFKEVIINPFKRQAERKDHRASII